MRTTKHKSTSSKPIRSVYPLFTNAPAKTSNEFYVVVNPVSKLYTDDMGWLSIRSCSGHRYIMLAFNCDSNVILIEPFQPCHDRHRIAVYIRIMTRLQERGHAVDLQVLEKEASAEYRRTITQPWKGKFQLVPPDVHCRNAAEHAIRTFKAHFLASIAGVDRAFPSSLWDTLLPQMELTLKLLRQATLAPEISAWEYYKEPLTTTPHCSAQLDAKSPFTTNPDHARLGTSAHGTDSASAQPYTTTAATQLLIPPPRLYTLATPLSSTTTT